MDDRARASGAPPRAGRSRPCVPIVWPPLTPPPAIHMVKPHGLWSRPLPFSLNGVRPNSPPQTTSVSSSRPRAFRSVEQAGDRLVGRPAPLRVVAFDVRCARPSRCRCREYSSTNRTPRSTSRRASRQFVPNSPVPRRPCRTAFASLRDSLRQIDRFRRRRLHADTPARRSRSRASSSVSLGLLVARSAGSAPSADPACRAAARRRSPFGGVRCRIGVALARNSVP